MYNMTKQTKAAIIKESAETFADSYYPKEPEGVPFLCDSSDVSMFKREGFKEAVGPFIDSLKSQGYDLLKVGGGAEGYLEGKVADGEGNGHAYKYVLEHDAIAALQALKEDCDAECDYMVGKAIVKYTKQIADLTAEVERLKGLIPSHTYYETPTKDLIKNVVNYDNPPKQ